MNAKEFHKLSAAIVREHFPASVEDFEDEGKEQITLICRGTPSADAQPGRSHAGTAVALLAPAWVVVLAEVYRWVNSQPGLDEHVTLAERLSHALKAAGERPADVAKLAASIAVTVIQTVSAIQ